MTSKEFWDCDYGEEQRKSDNNLNEQLEKQLAAEREKWNHMQDVAKAQGFNSLTAAFVEIDKLRDQLDVERQNAHQAEQAARDNADWFDNLCIDLRKLLGLPEAQRPFEVSPILDAVKAKIGEKIVIHFISRDLFLIHRDRQALQDQLDKRRTLRLFIGLFSCISILVYLLILK